MILLLLAMQVSSAISLFDGKTLNGWVLENTTAEKIVVKDGVIRVEQGSGWLRSNREFKDFVLTLEFRFLNVEANSGVYIRTAPTSNPNPGANGIVSGRRTKSRPSVRELPFASTGCLLRKEKWGACQAISGYKGRRPLWSFEILSFAPKQCSPNLLVSCSKTCE